MKAVLSSCTEMYTLECCSCSSGFGESPVDHFYIRDWGKAGNIDDLQISWHVPTLEELEFVNELLDKHMVSELSSISNAKTMTR